MLEIRRKKVLKCSNCKDGKCICLLKIGYDDLEDGYHGECTTCGAYIFQELGPSFQLDGREQESHMERVFSYIRRERAQQDAEWGVQNHTPEYWMVILMEEVGEACQAICGKTVSLRDYLDEVVHVAAVAVAALECHERESSCTVCLHPLKLCECVLDADMQPMENCREATDRKANDLMDEATQFPRPCGRCGFCGGKQVAIRGKHPGEAERLVCPRCLQERLDNHIASSTGVGAKTTGGGL